jgi:hypothetical protein
MARPLGIAKAAPAICPPTPLSSSLQQGECGVADDQQPSFTLPARVLAPKPGRPGVRRGGRRPVAASRALAPPRLFSCPSGAAPVAARRRHGSWLASSSPGHGDRKGPRARAAKRRRAACARWVCTGVGADTARQYTAFTATRNLQAHARGGHVPRVR